MSEETGASGVNYEFKCPICGKEGDQRSEYCKREDNKLKCPNTDKSCEKRSTQKDRKKCSGYREGHKGNGGRLGANILGRGEYESRNKTLHPLYTGSKSIEAHHLICSDALANNKWKKICEITGYNINCWLNGIFLPQNMIVACHSHLQRHKGDHELGDAINSSYELAVKTELEIIISDFQEDGDVCDEMVAQSMVSNLNSFSERLFTKIIIAPFTWTVAWDGFNYEPGGIGCANSNDLKVKRSNLKIKLKDKLEEKGITDTFIHTNVYSYDDMRNLKSTILDTLEEAMCDMQRDHAPRNADWDKSRELTPLQAGRIADFKKEIGY